MRRALTSRAVLEVMPSQGAGPCQIPKKYTTMKEVGGHSVPKKKQKETGRNLQQGLAEGDC